MRISIRAARTNKGLTQAEAATALNVTKKTVCSWEKYRTKPSVDKVEKICDLYDVEYDDIKWNAN